MAINTTSLINTSTSLFGGIAIPTFSFLGRYLSLYKGSSSVFSVSLSSSSQISYQARVLGLAISLILAAYWNTSSYTGDSDGLAVQHTLRFTSPQVAIESSPARLNAFMVGLICDFRMPCS